MSYVAAQDILLQRDAMHGLCRRVVSVRLPVTFVYCVGMAKDTAIVAMAYETVPSFRTVLTILNNFKRPLTRILKVTPLYSTTQSTSGLSATAELLA